MLRPGNETLAKGTYMITISQDGKTVLQDEVPPRFWPPEKRYVSVNPMPYKLAPGLYDFRIEGEGAVTVTKQGIQLLSGYTKARYVYFDLQPGKGAKVVQYTTDGSSKEKKK